MPRDLFDKEKKLLSEEWKLLKKKKPRVAAVKTQKEETKIVEAPPAMKVVSLLKDASKSAATSAMDYFQPFAKKIASFTREENGESKFGEVKRLFNDLKGCALLLSAVCEGDSELKEVREVLGEILADRY